MRRFLWIFSITILLGWADLGMAADLILPSNLNGNYYTDGNIATQGACTVPTGSNVKCSTFGEITLNPGFETMAGSAFYADINNQDDADADGLPDWWGLAFTSSDPQTVLLVHSNTAEGSRNFLDSSPKKHSILAVGDVKHSTAQAVFSRSAVYFDGSGDYLQLADNDDWYLDQGDWTIDFWMRPDDGIARGIFGQSVNATTQPYFYLSTSGTGQLVYNHYYIYYYTETQSVAKTCSYTCDTNCPCYCDSEHGCCHCTYYVNETVQKSTTYNENFTTAASVITAGQWQHIALVRQGNTITLYRDGTAVGNKAVAVNYNQSAPLLIGRDGKNPDFKGYISEFRVSKGVARWTGSFTPPANVYDGVTAALSIDKSTIYYSQNAVLTWNTTQVAPFTTYNITPSIGPIVANGLKTITPGPGENIFILTVIGPFNTATANAKVTVLLDPTGLFIDADGDGLHDAWELIHFGDLRYDRNDDPDVDGFSNYLEMLSGSDPNNTLSKPKVGTYYEYDAIGRIKKIFKVK